MRISICENHQGADETSRLDVMPASSSATNVAAHRAWVAVEDGLIVGFTMIDEDRGTLFAAFVRPECEGRGIGRALISGAEAALFRRHPVISL